MQDGNGNKLLPFELSITVHKADKLAVADMLTSDPYVIVDLDDSNIGRTSTIYRSLSPVWEKEFAPIPLYHLHHVIYFRVMDADNAKQDDSLGHSSVDLHNVPFNSPLRIELKLDQTIGSSIQVKGFLTVTLFLKRNDRLIHLEKTDWSSASNSIFQMESYGFSDPVLKCMRDSLNSTADSALHDFMYDIISLSSKTLAPFSSEPSGVERQVTSINSNRIIPNSKQHQSAYTVMLDVESGEFSNVSLYSGMDIVLHMKNNMTHVIQFPDSSTLWKWTRCLMLCFDLMYERVPAESCPSWASDLDCLISNKQIVVHLHQNYEEGKSSVFRSYLGFFKLSTNALMCRSMDQTSLLFTIDLGSVKNIIVPHQYPLPGQYSLHLDLIGISDGKSFEGRFHELDPRSYCYEPQAEDKDNSSFFSSIFGCGCTNKSVLSAVDELSSSRSYIVVKSQNSRHVSETVSGDFPIWRESAYLDFDLMSSTCDLSRYSKNCKGFYAFLMQGLSGFERNNGVAFINFSDLLPSDLYENEDFPIPRKLCGERYLEFNRTIEFHISISKISLLLWESRQTTFTLRCICKFATDLGSHCGKSHNIANFKQLNTNTWVSLGNDTKCSLNAADGLQKADFVRVDIQVDNVLASESLGSVFIPIQAFSEETLNFTLPISLFKHLNEMAPKLANKGIFSKGLTVGEIELSISRTISINGALPNKFTFRYEVEKIFPCSQFWPCEVVLGGNTSVSAHPEPIESFTVTPNFDCIIFKPEQNNFLWYGNKISRDMLNEESILKPETRSSRVSSLFSSWKANRNSRLSSIDSSTHDRGMLRKMSSLSNVESTQMTSLRNLLSFPASDSAIEIEVYENERRVLTSWRHGNLLPHEFAPFSNKEGTPIGKIESIQEVYPPDGYSWIDDWAVDINDSDGHSLRTDGFGWIYALDFLAIKRLLNENTTTAIHKISSTAASLLKSVDGLHVRSRKWIRHAKLHSKTPIRLHLESIFPSTSFDWRKDIFSHDINMGISDAHVLSTCKQRESFSSSICIPYSNLIDIYAISETSLSLRIQVDRYFPTTSDFKPVELDVIVVCCDALELKSLFEERRRFVPLRQKVVDCIKYYNARKDKITQSPSKWFIYKSYDKASLSPSTKLGISRIQRSQSRLIDDINEIDVNESLGEEISPDMEELAIPCQTYFDMDNECVALQNRIDEIKSMFEKKEVAYLSSSLSRELHLVEDRYLHCKLYISFLLGLGFESEHNFEESSILRLIAQDREASTIIRSSVDDVTNVVNRLDYIMNMAEFRILDCGLCGWNVSDKKFSQSLEVMCNDYLIEIVGILGSYFDGSKHNETKGWQRKIKLLVAFMTQNDRIQNALDVILRSYDLVANVRCQLSLFLNAKILIAWYATVLNEETIGVVDNAVGVWKNIANDASGNSNLYKSALPWIPMRSDGSRGFFLTTLPQDTMSFLDQYISFARVSEDVIAPSFRNIIQLLDVRLCSSYVVSIGYLCDIYWRELRSCLWSNPRATYQSTSGKSILQNAAYTSQSSISTVKPLPGPRPGFLIHKIGNFVRSRHSSTSNSNQEQTSQIASDIDELAGVLEERIEFLCSVANDASRISESRAIDSEASFKSLLGSACDTSFLNSTGTMDKDIANEFKQFDSFVTNIQSKISDTYSSYSLVSYFAIDLISSVIFASELLYLGENNLFQGWMNSPLPNASTLSSIDTFATSDDVLFNALPNPVRHYFESIFCVLEALVSYLPILNFKKLCVISIQRMISLLLYFVVESFYKGLFWDVIGTVNISRQFYFDVQYIIMKCREFSSKIDQRWYDEELASLFSFIDPISRIFSFSMTKDILLNDIGKILSLAQKDTQSALFYADILEMGIINRSDSESILDVSVLESIAARLLFTMNYRINALQSSPISNGVLNNTNIMKRLSMSKTLPRKSLSGAAGKVVPPDNRASTRQSEDNNRHHFPVLEFVGAVSDNTPKKVVGSDHKENNKFSGASSAKNESDAEKENHMKAVSENEGDFECVDGDVLFSVLSNIRAWKPDFQTKSSKVSSTKIGDDSKKNGSFKTNVSGVYGSHALSVSVNKLPAHRMFEVFCGDENPTNSISKLLVEPFSIRSKIAEIMIPCGSSQNSSREEKRPSFPSIPSISSSIANHDNVVLEISDLSVMGLFPISSFFSSPNVYIEISFGNQVKKTSSKSFALDLFWNSSKDVISFVFSAEEYLDALQRNLVNFRIFYKGRFFGDEPIGQCNINATSLDIINVMEHKEIPVSLLSTNNPKIEAAAQKSKSSGYKELKIIATLKLLS